MINRVCFAVLFCALSTGCATIVTGGGPDQKVRVISEPSGAKVYVGGEFKGVTPISIAVTRKDDHLFRVEYEGYPPFERQLKSGVNPWLFGNIIFGGLIGIVVDLASGATNSPSPDNLDVKFARESDVAANTMTASSPAYSPPKSSPSASGPPFQPYTAPPGQGVVYVYRPLGSDSLGSVEIKCDGKIIGAIGNNGYAGAFIVPGRHVVTATTDTNEVTVTTEVGQSYYIEATVSNNRPHLRQVPEQNGKAAILGTHWSGL